MRVNRVYSKSCFSGVARRFKKIIEYLARTDNYLIHVVTGCKGCETAWENEPFMQTKVTFSTCLFTIDFKDKLECALPFLIPQVRNQLFISLERSRN